MTRLTLKIRLSICALVCVLTQAGAQNVSVISPTDHHIQYVGRIDFSNPQCPTFTYPGVQVRAAFSGTSISMIAKPQSGYFMAKVDDGHPFKVAFVTDEDSIVSLATDLSRGRHTVEIMYVSEGYERMPEFRGFLVDAGEGLAKADPLPSRKIEFVGNSITCGYGIEADSARAPYQESTANHYYTYAAETARRLEAQHVVVARSGIGVYRNYNGPRSGDCVNMNTEYPYTLLYNNSHLWDFTRFVPDVVVINLGTNDVSTEGADTTLLVQAFARLYRQVRSHYAEAHIVLMSGTMLHGMPLATVCHAMDEVAGLAHAQGDTLVHRLDLAPQDGTLGYGASFHPSMRQHHKMADELTVFLRKIMGW